METRSHKRTWLWFALAGGLVVVDQVVKGLIRAALEVGQSRPLIPWLIELYHVENTGAAFSMLEDHTWVLTALSAVVTVLLVLCIWKGRLADTGFSRLCLTLVLAGAAGNLIDRVSRGRVTDMFNFTFVRFGVFNVADICVVCGIFGYVLWLLVTQVRGGNREREDGDEADAERTR